MTITRRDPWTSQPKLRIGRSGYVHLLETEEVRGTERVLTLRCGVRINPAEVTLLYPVNARRCPRCEAGQ